MEVEGEGIVGVLLDCMADFGRGGSVVGCRTSIEGIDLRVCLLGKVMVVVVAGAGRKAGRHLVEVLARRANVVGPPFARCCNLRGKGWKLEVELGFLAVLGRLDWYESGRSCSPLPPFAIECWALNAWCEAVQAPVKLTMLLRR